MFTRQGRRPHLSVTIALSTLAGLDNLPGTLAGFGAIPAGLARSIAASAATINALITDPDTGVPTAAGALTYRPTQELRDHIAALLGVCQFPSCRKPVWRCDLDHRESFNHQHPEDGGKTTNENTGPMCRRHHLMKHHTAWRMRIDPHHTVIEWTSPTGHMYRKRGHQAAVPGMWVSTAATAIAERLDHIANLPSPTSTLLLHRGNGSNDNADREKTGDDITGSANTDCAISGSENTDCDNTGSADNNRRDDNGTAPTSHIEDLLAAILIRHHLNTKPIEIDYQPDTFWKSAELDDPPPF